MRIVRLALGAAIGAALFACEPIVEPPDAPLVDALAPSFAMAGPVMEAVTGSAKFHRTPGTGETYVHSAALTARRYSDGSVRGMYVATSRTGNYKGDVVCFTVEGNEAWLGIVVTRSNRGVPPVGDLRVVYVMDNGEGALDPPDRSTAFPPLGITGLPSLEAYCDETPEIRERSVFDIEWGNIQIRP